MRNYSIAMVAACPFPANHGTPAAIREMSQELARRGHSVHVVTYPLSDNIPIHGVEINRVRHFGSNRTIRVGPNCQRVVFDFLLVFKLLEVIRTRRIDIIHAHNYEAALIAGLVGRITGLPVIYNAINTMIGELPSFRFIRPQALAIKCAQLLDYITPRVADAVIADTAELHRFLLDLGVAPNRIVTVNSGVWPDMFASGNAANVRDRFELGDAPLIIYTGTFDAFQGIDYLLAAFRIVRRQEPLARLLLVGSTISSIQRERYARMAEDLGVASGVIITSCALAELADFLAAADIAVVPRPESGGIPTKLLNYMAAGKAIVSFAKSGAILENGKTGCLVAPATAEAFADGITSLFVDRNLRLTLGRNAQKSLLGRFDWPSIIDQIEEVYAKVLAEKAVKQRLLTNRPAVRGRRRAKAVSS